MQVSENWGEMSSLDVSLSIYGDLALRHASRGGAHGSRIGEMIRGKQYKSICEYELPLSQPLQDPKTLYHARQALSFFKKLEDLDVGIDKEAVAWEKFKKSESQCGQTNDLFRAFFASSVNLRARDVRVLYAARRKIKTALGRCPQIGELRLRLGPGSTTSIRKTDACPQNKFADGLYCSLDLLASGYLPDVLRELPHWADEFAVGHEVEITYDEPEAITIDAVTTYSVAIANGRLEFVPKNALTYRSIVVEPVLSGMLQMGIGDWITERLLSIGLDIRHDQKKHGLLAYLASLSGDLATLDLSSASDTIAFLLVKFLLPAQWFRLLCCARSGTVEYHGEQIVLQKFSSMGNGFTFPLETLIFWALSAASCPPDQVDQVHVYGDDIIVPTDAVDDVKRTLALCGFSLNTAKSFTSGPFRESCGADYYMGIDVRPVAPQNRASGANLFVIHNYYARRNLWEFADVVKSYIPTGLCIYGPDGYGDGHLLSHDGEYPKKRSKKILAKGYSGHAFETFRFGSRKTVSKYPGDFVSPLYTVYRKGHTALHESIGFFKFPEEAVVQEFTDSGRPIWTVPGTNGYSRTSIYVLH